ncbi:MAG: hypothetical protein BWX87_00659 [Bacteroidetes bacterium ADurb.Bin123]|jgi:hypothetical protein|nr:MAG: hypothetical protein BWX87_00659 [Bacteroidetes bacterium ADurb.Bin123]
MLIINNIRVGKRSSARVQLGTLLKPSPPVVDYSGIITSLNLLTNTEDTVYRGRVPTLSEMNTQLDDINNEIIIA